MSDYKYKIIYALEMGELENLVERRLSQGWECVGGLVINTHSGYSLTYNQAMQWSIKGGCNCL